MKLLLLAAVVVAWLGLVWGNELIGRYQPLSDHHLRITHSRSHLKRSVATGTDNTLDDLMVIEVLLAHQEHTLMLTRVPPAVRDVRHFSVNTRRVDVDRLYQGYVKGHPAESSVLGFINLQGRFEGRVTLGNLTHMIESHSIVSDGDDLYDPAQYPLVTFSTEDLSPLAFQGHCGVTDKPIQYRMPEFTRGRRAESAPPDNTCKVLVLADHLFTKAHGNNIDSVANILSYVVTEADNIFRETEFGGAKGYGLQIASMLIFTEEDATDPKYPFYGQASNVGSTVLLHALNDWTRSRERSGALNRDYCLVFAFTDRDFKGVLGEAFTSQTCSAYNSGIVTVNLSGSKRPRLMTALTFTHEAGHSFGSPHDQSQECSPGGIKGNYIMHWQAQDGMRENNALFSPCSRAAIAENIEGMRRSLTRDCLATEAAATCGNRVLEDGEQCDCGFDDQCQDKCCVPANLLQVNVDGCQLTGNSQCSPSGSECCNPDSCTANKGGQPCGDGLECYEPRTCLDNQPKCPEPAVKRPDGYLCQNDTKTCHDGACVASLCLNLDGLEPCSCAVDQLENKDAQNCVICCQRPGEECKPIHTLEPDRWWEEVYVSVGDLCTNEDGYCDVYHRCRKFGEEGFLLSVVKNLFSKEQWSDFATQYWWVLVITVAALIVGIGLFVHFFAIYTPTQNPNLKDKKYRGPKHYLQKQVSHYQEKKQRAKDQPDADRPPLSAAERRKKAANRFKQRRRVVVNTAPKAESDL